MEWYFLAAAAALGLIFGSFINALSYRFNTGRGMGGRSYCDTCGHTLSPLDLVPVFSYLFLRGRCRYCRSKISIQNPLVEVIAAALSALSWAATPSIAAFFFWFIVWMTLLFVVVYDLRHTIIPWRCSGILAALALFSLFFDFSALSFHMPAIWALAARPLLALPLFLLSLVSRGRWMGWGDGALELGIGWFLGLSSGATALMCAFWSGAAIGIALILLKKGLKMNSELPFAPFLVFGMFLAYFFHVDLFSMVLPW
ncbi:MAG TPA: prepilin peptidase [Candidatus Paceibacterota bacterium]|nr:prepilin peptidase [Candidatus Paceibacterota bacterium]